MKWDGQEKRSGRERRVLERRGTSRYQADTVLILGGITWIDADGTDRRIAIRRRDDRERLAQTIIRLAQD